MCLTSADLVFRALQARQGLADGDDAILDELFPADRAAPIVTVLDGHPHTLSFLSAIRGVPIACLGVHDFGQSGDVDDLYRHVGIDADTIVGAAVDLLGLTISRAMSATVDLDRLKAIDVHTHVQASIRGGGLPGRLARAGGRRGVRLRRAAHRARARGLLPRARHARRLLHGGQRPVGRPGVQRGDPRARARASATR